MGPLGLLYRLRKEIGDFWRGRQAVSAVEFSFIAGPFLYLLLAILETGYVFALGVLLEGATADGARQIRTGVVQQNADPAGTFLGLVCQTMSPVVPCSNLHFDARHFTTFGGITSAALPTTQGSTFDTGSPGDIVVVRVAYQRAYITPFLQNLLSTSSYGARNLVATVVIRTEPY